MIRHHPIDSDAGFGRRPIMPPMGGAHYDFAAKWNVGYDGRYSTEDQVLQETSDKINFQACYVLRHPWKGGDSTRAAEKEYRRQVTQRQLADLRAQMSLRSPDSAESGKWWQKLWSR